MKAPVGRVVIFFFAGRAERKACHGGSVAVIGQILNNGQPRAAVGAVYKRVAEAAVERVEQLPQAVVAGGAVWRAVSIKIATSAAFKNFKRCF